MSNTFIPGVSLLLSITHKHRNDRLEINAAEFNDYNSALFNIRARSLNSLMDWLSQTIGSWMIGLVLDNVHLRRRARAFTSWTILLAMAFLIHIWAYGYQR